MKEVELIQVIHTCNKTIGEGTPASPLRKLDQYWSLDGTLLFEINPEKSTIQTDLESLRFNFIPTDRSSMPKNRPGRKPKALKHESKYSDAKIAGIRQELSFAKSQDKLTENQIAALDSMKNMRVKNLTDTQKQQLISIYEDIKQ